MQGLELLGRFMVLAGVVLVLVGGVLWGLAKIPSLSNLPGTIKIETSGITCIFPLLASVILSLVLTVALNIIVRLINR
ncbi:hypothetical protein SE15_12360 [Thermanaerothrix daxensis]|uniref:DUF2905 domain-containing protein n=1 Tax=Thermanaerothrix daxensis TaxID=869279 RepID=A0A0P6Y1B8_9CHLR|nr:DUF2905 family protein [Thermanaerothrix daxensis]KPL82835.1 hypothetical protein SE15_12360 [Thermanaerothrix daxensis]